MNSTPEYRAAFRFVVLIGFVSLFSDMTYQGAHGNAGPFLGLLGASGTVVGIVAGGGELLNYLLRLFSGVWVDRSRRYWTIAFIGYLVNLLAVPMLALAGSWHAAALLLLVERAGKGLRTPARDVMLSHAADRVGRGFAFGVHEALDQTGAMLGPLCVAALLALRGDYRAGFAILAVPALVAIALLVFTWRVYPNPEKLAGATTHVRAPLPRAFWVFLVGLGLLALGYADFALLGFHMLKASILKPAFIPVAYAAAMGLQGAVSIVAGRLFDRWGLPTMLIAILPGAAFAPLIFLGSGGLPVWIGVGAWSVGMGIQSSVMKAFVAQIVGAGSRGSAYGVMNSVYGVLWFAGSALMGILYDHSIFALVVFSLGALALAVPFLVAAHRLHFNPRMS